LKVLTIIQLEDLTVEEAAERFSVTVRTIFRIMRRCREASADLEDEELQAFADAAD
jgi:DNA-directed RNA polymerase specialized sigma24 family protein